MSHSPKIPFLQQRMHFFSSSPAAHSSLQLLPAACHRSPPCSLAAGPMTSAAASLRGPRPLPSAPSARTRLAVFTGAQHQLHLVKEPDLHAMAWWWSSTRGSRSSSSLLGGEASVKELSPAEDLQRQEEDL